MKPFEYVNANSVSQAAEMMQRENADLLAGGTDLLDVLRNRLLPTYPDKVINLKNIPGLDEIREDEGGVHIGALATLSEIAVSPVVREKCGIVAEAARSVAAPNLRNTATLGGNLCQDIRCWYYRYPGSIGEAVNCARKEGRLCSAMMGENRYHSIFGGAKVCTTPCTGECPARTDIPGYMSALREGKVEEAARIILKANPMPAITSRVCAHFCQEGCNRAGCDETLNIGGVERYVGDYIMEHHEEFMTPPQKENGKSAGIVGSGPAGLAAAYYLRQSGYQVTIYERMPEAGGCLAYAIPAYRLPKDIVRRFVSILEGLGIQFRLGYHVGEDITLEEIHKKHDSLLLDTGAWKRPLIGISGEEMTRFGLDFLVDVNSYIHERPGSKVVVVGGGNVAVDVAITAKRLGAPEVTMVCLENREQMPANSEEIQRVLEEGVTLVNGYGPKRILKEGGQVSGMEFKGCPKVYDEQGRFAPVYDEADLMSLEADVVFMAVGQAADLSFLEGAYKVETERGRIKALDGNSTSVPGIFAGGDVTTGPATVVKAIAAGKNSAILMNRYMDGEPLPVERELENSKDPAKCAKGCDLLRFDLAAEELSRANRLAELPAEERAIDKEDLAGFTETEMRAEAGRCMNCGCLAVNPSDLANALVACDASIRTNLRTLTAEELLSKHTRVSDTLKQGEILLEVTLPKFGPDTVCRYDKFRLRDSIDFAVAAVASVYTLREGKFTDARLVLGAAAPVPLRAAQAEAYLIGKAPTEETAAEAAELALAGALPLSDNAYKIDVFKTLVRRSLAL